MKYMKYMLFILALMGAGIGIARETCPGSYGQSWMYVFEALSPCALYVRDTTYLAGDVVISAPITHTGLMTTDSISTSNIQLITGADTTQLNGSTFGGYYDTTVSKALFIDSTEIKSYVTTTDTVTYADTAIVFSGILAGYHVISASDTTGGAGAIRIPAIGIDSTWIPVWSLWNVAADKVDSLKASVDTLKLYGPVGDLDGKRINWQAVR